MIVRASFSSRSFCFGLMRPKREINIRAFFSSCDVIISSYIIIFSWKALNTEFVFVNEFERWNKETSIIKVEEVCLCDHFDSFFSNDAKWGRDPNVCLVAEVIFKINHATLLKHLDNLSLSEIASVPKCIMQLHSEQSKRWQIEIIYQEGLFQPGK